MLYWGNEDLLDWLLIQIGYHTDRHKLSKMPSGEVERLHPVAISKPDWNNDALPDDPSIEYRVSHRINAVPIPLEVAPIKMHDNFQNGQYLHAQYFQHTE